MLTLAQMLAGHTHHAGALGPLPPTCTTTQASWLTSHFHTCCPLPCHLT